MEWPKKVFLALLKKNPNSNIKIELCGFQDYSVLQPQPQQPYNYEPT